VAIVRCLDVVPLIAWSKAGRCLTFKQVCQTELFDLARIILAVPFSRLDLLRKLKTSDISVPLKTEIIISEFFLALYF
jgi:hypothetical protein